MNLVTGISVLTLCVSAFSAYSSFEARRIAEELNARRFDTESTLRLLSDSWKELQATGECDPKRAVFLKTLARAEEKAGAIEPRLVALFLRDMEEQGYWTPSCAVFAESALPTSSGDGSTLQTVIAREDTAAPGLWHTVIASYDVSTRGCEKATDDIAEFATLLAGKVPPKTRLTVLQTRISGHYAVTLDAGDSRDTALAMRAEVIQVSGSTADRRTGADSFVQESRDWVAPQGCTASHTF